MDIKTYQDDDDTYQEEKYKLRINPILFDA